MTPAPLQIPEGTRLSRPPRPRQPCHEDDMISLLRDDEGHVLAKVESLGAPSSYRLPRDD